VAEIPTGVDCDRFKNGDGKGFRKKAGLEQTALVIGHVGRLAPEKNLGFLASAVKISLRQNQRAKFLIVGDGPSAAWLKTSFAEDRLTDRLIMAGKKTGADLADAYCAMDVFVFSSHSETQGLVVAEAMAAGCPVVALNASGVREVVTDHHNGRLLPADATAESFAAAITDFFNNSEAAGWWRQNAWATARKFDRIKMAGELADLYQLARQKKLKSTHEYKHFFDNWENLLNGIKTEWEILSSKVGVIADTFSADETRSRQ